MGMADAGDRVAARRSCSALCLRRGLADGTARRQPRRAGYAGCQIATQTRIDAAALAHNVSGGNKELAKALIWNGPVDAWRHAEWNRRMASDPQVGSTFAAIVGVGHEVQNLYEKITGQGAPGQTWTQFAQESIMDLSNNRLGRTQAELGAQVISLSDPGLVFGSGGPQGQPNVGVSDYLFGSIPVNQNLGAFASGSGLSPYSGGMATGINPRLFK